MAMRLPSDPKESVPYLRGYYDAKEDYEVKHGHWIFTNLYPKCSICGLYGVEDMQYCPNCGATMDEVEE